MNSRFCFLTHMCSTLNTRNYFLIYLKFLLIVCLLALTVVPCPTICSFFFTQPFNVLYLTQSFWNTPIVTNVTLIDTKLSLGSLHSMTLLFPLQVERYRLLFTNVSFLFSQLMVTLEGKLRVAKEIIVIPLQLKIFLLYLTMNKIEKNLMFTSGMHRADLFGCGAGRAGQG